MYLQEFLWKVISLFNPVLGWCLFLIIPFSTLDGSEELSFFEQIVQLPTWIICLFVFFVIVTTILFIYSIYLLLPTISKDNYGIKIEPAVRFNGEGYIVASGLMSVFILGSTICFFFLID